ncbi:MAG TPA: ABC transporter permease [Pseudonocardiaceae bacterium]|jgi:lipooligosaccharide transport system permease protein|nr:ABC transporter permease [Pseudonocardiaceae bacterium]
MAALAFVNRNLMVYRHTWGILVASVLEPLLYLVSIGVGVGQLVGTLPGLGDVSYAQYVAPALLATAAMNAAVNETTFSAYTRLREEHVYDAILRTPLTPADLAIGEIGWGAARGALSGAGFLAVMAALGLVRTPVALLAVLAAALTGASFGALGLLVMTFLRNWQDFQLIQLFMLPMFLFSATFYPVTVYPTAIQVVVRALPLYPSIDLLRGVTLDDIGPQLAYAIAYLLVIGLVAWRLAARRLRRILIT